jgi:peptidoglycan/xylan/chitin deacetylase (PgdA/CDA1 family)
MRSISRSTIAVIAALAAVGSLAAASIASAATAPKPAKTLVCKDVTAKGGAFKATGIRVTRMGCAEARNDLASWLKQGSKSLPHVKNYWHSRKVAGGKWLSEYGNKKARPTITFIIKVVPKPKPAPVPTPTPAPQPAPDTQAPAITLDSPVDGAHYDLGQVVTAHFACTDNVGLATCSGTVADGYAIPTDKLGGHTFTVTATDKAGNTATKSVTYSVADTTGPKVLISAPVDGQRVESGSTLTAYYTCTDNAAVATCFGTVASGATIPTNVPGTFKFSVTATDTAGNVTTVSVTYTVGDATPPQITITSPTTGATYTWAQGQKAAYTCSDNVAVASCTASVGGVISVANGAVLPASGVPTAGASTLTVTAKDTSGNTSTQMVTNYVVQPAGYYALTFHDGPDPTYTQPVLNALAGVNAHATFFLIGVNANLYPGIAKTIVTSGMQVGNHTMNHHDIASSFNNPFYQRSDPMPFGDSATKEITDGKNAIIAATGVTPKWFEPPYGDYGIDGNVQGYVTAAGETLCAWTVDSTDSADPVPSSATIVANATTVQTGGIIEMHDASQQTVDSIGPIVTQLAAKGLLPGQIVSSATGVPGPFGSPQPSFYCSAGAWS